MISTRKSGLSTNEEVSLKRTNGDCNQGTNQNLLNHSDQLASSGSDQRKYPLLPSPPVYETIPNETANVDLPSQEYLDQLIKDRSELHSLNSSNSHFKHLNKLIDREINRVISMMSDHLRTENSSSEECFQEKIVLSEMILIPVEDFPRYNFVGRILGPRGMTAKQLEEETGCKIMVRGRGSSRMYQNGSRRDRSNDLEPLHVLIQCEDFKNRAQSKMKNAIHAINELLNPPPEGKDELKRKQLIELSIINGTYRPTSATKVALQSPRPSSVAHLPSLLDESPYTETARILSSLVDPSNKIIGPRSHSKKTDSTDDTYGSVAQLLSILNPTQQAMNINPTLAAEYYKNLFSFSLSDPSVISAIMCANHSIDPYGLSNSSSSNTVHLDHSPHTTGGPIPQANLHQYLTAAAILNSIPYIHDGSGDAPKVKR